MAYNGTWKFSYEIFENLVGFRDPNSVPIKEFYEPSTRLNYLATFVNDKSLAVRIAFYKCIGNWLLMLPDRKDHEGRIFPYMLTSLNDENEDI